VCCDKELSSENSKSSFLVMSSRVHIISHYAAKHFPFCKNCILLSFLNWREFGKFIFHNGTRDGPT
jgi:hypothetical protein